FDLSKLWVIDLEAENVKLKQIIEENAKRKAENVNLKVELEKNKKDITYLSAENSELKIKVAKLSCDFEEIKSKGIITNSPKQLSISEKKKIKPSYKNQNLESSIISQSISNSSELSLDNNLSDQSNSSCGSEFKSLTNLSPNQRHEVLCSAKIPYNQKVERGLRLELSICTKDNNNKISKVFDIQIPEFSLEAILSGSSSITSQNIVDLFRIAMKIRQKE
ncbi:10307_t:CDS:2, partial [Diversispora eburnea]